MTLNTDGADQQKTQQASIGAHGSDSRKPDVKNINAQLPITASGRKPAGRIPVEAASATKRVRPQRVPVANTDFVIDRLQSRLDVGNTAQQKTPRRPAGRVEIPQSTGNVPATSTVKKLAQRVPLTKPVSNTEKDSRQRQKDDVVRTKIQFDDYDDNIHSEELGTASSIPETQGTQKYELKKAVQSLALCDKTESLDVVKNIYCDRPSDHKVHSSPSWHDNMLSAGKGGVRSPLSVIGWSPGGRKLTRGELVAKKTARRVGDLASAQKAVAELIATVEMNNCTENTSPLLQQKQPSSRREKPTVITTEKVGADVKNTGTGNVQPSLLTKVSGTDDGIGVKQELPIEQKTENDFDSDAEDKENIFHGWSRDEVAEICDNVDVNRMVSDTVEQLERQARTLRRRSQLSTDSSEYESILQQLKQVRQRQAELEKMQMKLHSRLLQCRSTSSTEQPLNLKVTSASEEEHVSQDIMEPLDLRIPSVKQSEKLTDTNGTRVVLADITSEINGDADPDDCFEVADSPPAAATDAESTNPVQDAADMDGVVPICENFSDDHERVTCVITEDNIVESRMKSTPIHLSPSDCIESDAEKARVVGVLDQYLASLNVSDISEADTPSPTTANVASPDTSSEFYNYQTYQRILDASDRCLDPIAAALLDGDEQHFRPISEGNVESAESQ